MKSLTPPIPAELRERRMGGSSTAAHSAPSTRMTRIATSQAQPFPVPHIRSIPDLRPTNACRRRHLQTQSEIPEDLARWRLGYQRMTNTRQALRAAFVQVTGLFRDSSAKVGARATSRGR